MEAYFRRHSAVCNCIEWADVLIRYLKRKGVKLENDMAVIPPENLVRTVPQGLRMIPASKRSVTKTPEKSILCNFEGDAYLYCHIRSIVRAIKKGDETMTKVMAPYRKFHAVTGFDLTITPGMD